MIHSVCTEVAPVEVSCASGSMSFRIGPWRCAPIKCDFSRPASAVTDKFSKAVKFLPGRKDGGAPEWAEKVHKGVTLNG
jgi:hypothetical protein